MMAEQTPDLTSSIFPKCPFYRSAPLMALTLAIIVLGTVGIYFLNMWVAAVYLVYSIVYYFFAMPIWHCQYCYFKVKETAKGPMTVDEWQEAYLQKHVDNGKKWVINFMLIWFLPIILIVISFFLSFSVFALLSLIGLVVLLVAMMRYMKQRVCPECEIKEECHAAF